MCVRQIYSGNENDAGHVTILLTFVILLSTMNE